MHSNSSFCLLERSNLAHCDQFSQIKQYNSGHHKLASCVVLMPVSQSTCRLQRLLYKILLKYLSKSTRNVCLTLSEHSDIAANPGRHCNRSRPASSIDSVFLQAHCRHLWVDASCLLGNGDYNYTYYCIFLYMFV